MLQLIQQRSVNKAANLFLQTQIAFANCEANGIKIDVPYLEQAITDTKKQIVDLERKIFETEVGKRWTEIFGNDKALTARQQLGVVLFKNTKSPHPKNMGYSCSTWTVSGLPQISEGTLERIHGLEEFAADYALWMSLTKMLATNLYGIKGCLDPNGYIHPSFSLFSAVTYRSASAWPNLQNIPNRGPLAATVRRCFIPRSPNRHLAELDYSGAEVRVNASLNQDPTLLDSINHGVDFHKSIAAMAYKLPEEEVTKELRQSVKGAYTFAAFYGSYWVAIAEGLWNGIAYGGLKLKDGTPLIDYLREQGISGLGDSENPAPDSYYAHIKKTEQWFWGEKFQVYAAWKEKMWKEYQETGYINLPTGFRCAGVFSKNLVTNAPAQGGAAHCLLWSFVHLDKAIQELGLQTKICGEIHDSILLDIPHEELDDVLRLANDIMTTRLREAQPWISVPMEIEADVAPMGKSWWDKVAYEIPQDKQDG